MTCSQRDRLPEAALPSLRELNSTTVDCCIEYVLLLAGPACAHASSPFMRVAARSSHIVATEKKLISVYLSAAATPFLRLATLLPESCNLDCRGVSRDSNLFLYALLRSREDRSV